MCEAEFAAWHRLMCGLHGLRPEDVARADLPTGTDTDPQRGGGGAAAEAVVDAALLSDLEAALEYFKQEVSGCSMR